jgi:nucleoside-diphosphate-sugar epimerase
MSPCFVTGASGFIGGKLVERLRAAGRPVRALARRPLPELARLGAEIVRGDLQDAAALARGCAGAGTVFHVAGRVGVWGPADEFFRVNVEGTRTVLEAARSGGVARFVYTSSPSVVYNGGDLAGVDESAPLCRVAPCAYPTSKAAAEQLVLAANAPGFSTVALRPHLVWGPGDRNVVPRVLALAAKGRLKVVGGGANRVDLTHIDNVVDAHLLAEAALPGGPAVAPIPASPAGKAYFITTGEPVVLWEWINTLLRGLGRPPVTRRASLGTAYLAGGVMEFLWRVLPLAGEPPMTRFVAKELATDHWFRIDAARRDLGYQPRVSMADGTRQLIEELRRGA